MATPTAPKTLEVFGTMQGNLAEALVETVAEAVSVEWKEFYWDARSKPARTAPIAQLQVIPVSGPTIAVAPPAALAVLLLEFWQVRQTIRSLGMARDDYHQRWRVQGGVQLPRQREGSPELRGSTRSVSTFLL